MRPDWSSHWPAGRTGTPSKRSQRRRPLPTGLPAHAVSVVPVPAIPRVPSGKVDQAAVARLEGPPADAGRTAADSLTTLYGAVLGRRDVMPSDTFAALGGDSLSYVELSLRLEVRLGRLPVDWPGRDDRRPRRPHA